MAPAPRPIALLLATLLLAACGGGDGPQPASTCSPTCPGGRDYDAQAYELVGRFDWTARRLIASENVTLRLAAAGQARVELDSAVHVGRVHAGATDLPFTADATGQVLRVELAPLGAQNPVTFTIEYEAEAVGSLIAAGARDDDPVAARVVYTDSEPDQGRNWLVANHRPADRARWSVELTVGADEDVIANGRRVVDQAVSGGRRIRYEMEPPLPTYLMAFAAGALVHVDRPTGGVPLSVWHRKGLVLDPQATLAIVAEAMATFEKVLGPYPWDTYSVVLVPQYGGGMENASITFNLESSGQGTVGVSLNAHELGHQWYGDWVTMHDFGDVWIKEGMATLLAAEAQRTRRDGEARGRRFGSDFAFDPTDAIVDPALHGLGKYTSGPYERAAWLLTQIRARVGETVFWKTLRDVLDAHALDSLDGATFLEAFAPALDAATIAQAKAALAKKGAPALAIASPGARQVTLTLTDPDALLLAPFHVTVVDAAGGATTTTLPVGQAVTLTVPAGGYLAPDEEEVHPWDGSFTLSGTALATVLAPLLVPEADAARAAFATRSAAHQERALRLAALGALPATGFASLYAALDSSIARRYAEYGGCGALVRDPGTWRAAVEPVLRAPSLLSFSTRYGSCGTAFATDAFAAELAAALDGLGAAGAGRVTYLASFDYGAAKSRELLGRLADVAPSLPLRDLAVTRLSWQAATGNGYSVVTAEEKPAWRELFRARLAGTTSSTRLTSVWRGVKGLADDGALATLGQRLQVIPLTAARQRQVICEAWTLAKARPAAFDELRAAAQPWTSLSADAQAVLATPEKCP